MTNQAASSIDYTASMKLSSDIDATEARQVVQTKCRVSARPHSSSVFFVHCQQWLLLHLQLCMCPESNFLDIFLQSKQGYHGPDVMISK